MRARLLDALPLAALILVSVIVALAIDVGFGGAVGMTLHASIGFLFCALAILKLMDFQRFAAALRYSTLSRRAGALSPMLGRSASSR